jgi:hypothetical protein
VGAGASEILAEANSGAAGAGKQLLSAASWHGSRGLKMSTGLVWRAVLFFGLTAGYVILAALPYLA